MTISQATGQRGKADKLFSLIVRSRGRCEHCGSTNWLQTAHIVPRRYARVRCDEANAFCLCAQCHARYTDHAGEWLAFIDSTIGRAEYDRLWQLARARGQRVDWKAEAERLALRWKDLAA